MSEELHLDAYERVRRRFLARVQGHRDDVTLTEDTEETLASTLPTADVSSLDGVGSAVDAILGRTDGDIGRRLLGRAALKERRRKSRRGRAQRLPELAPSEQMSSSPATVSETNLELRLTSNYELRSLPALFDVETKCFDTAHGGSFEDIITSELDRLHVIRAELEKETSVDKDHFSFDDVVGMLTPIAERAAKNTTALAPEEALDLQLRMSTLRMIALLRSLQHSQHMLRLKTEETLSLQRRLRVVNDFAREEQLMREEAETALVALNTLHSRHTF